MTLKKVFPVAEAVSVGCGLSLVALFAHGSGGQVVLSAAGWALAASGMVRAAFMDLPSLAGLLGIGPMTGRAAFFVVFGCVLGVGFAVAYRLHTGARPFFFGLSWVALVACLIGMAEEGVYRGWMMGVLEGKGMARAVVFAAVFHAGYKGALFVFSPSGQRTDQLFLLSATLFGGLVLGALRAFSGSLVPALAAHAVFDLVVYADHADFPWWVWS